MPSQTGTAKLVLEELKRGVPPEGLAIKKPWEEFERGDLDELLKMSRHMRENQLSYNLLVYLFRISNGKNLWYSAEVLSQAVQHPIMGTSDRQSILRTMRNRLDRIKDEISTASSSVENLRKYWVMEATYFAVNGATLVETGHKIEANQNYQIAQGIFEQLGLAQQAEKYKRLSQELAKDESTGKLAAMNAEPVKPAPTPVPIPPLPEPSQLEEIQATVVDMLEPANSPDVIQSPPSADMARPKPAPEPARSISTPVAKPHPTPSQTAILSTGELSPSLPARREPVRHVPASQAPAEPAILQPAPTDAFRPLPDVWMDKGQLHFQTSPGVNSDESRRLVEQIQQQSEILAGVQLQIQMYLDRRGILEREVKQLEKKVTNLKVKAERLEKKVNKLEEPK